MRTPIVPMASIEPMTAPAGAGGWAPVPGWQVASTADAGVEGELVSLPGYDASSWLHAPARSTVLAALVANGEAAPDDVFFSTVMRDRFDPARFAVPWWFRAAFRLSGPARTYVQVRGVIPRADLWVNGRRVLDAGALAGAYRVETVDVTEHVSPGLNALALLVYPGDPMQDLSIGWIDWAPPPPDHNMGPWRDVLVGRSGPVRLGPPHVTTTFDPEAGTRRAHLRVRAELHNRSGSPQRVLISGRVAREDLSIGFTTEVDVEAGATALVDVRGDRLVIDDPRLWWPIGEGEQDLYALALDASAEGIVSDHTETVFGIRTVTSDLRPGGGRQFEVNGRPVQILAGGWSPDLLLRHDGRRLASQIELCAHLGLNAIRPEGKLENPEFYELCDAAGIMTLPGWECCTKWEAAAGTGGTPWDDHDLDVAERSMASEAELLRCHPSVVGFLIGSDFAPPEPVAERYVAALEERWWDLPVVASATEQGTDASGPSGMKMTGPYDWVPPVYWYSRDPQRGGAVGFNSETSAGHVLPRLEGLRRMLSQGELERLWQHPEHSQYHSGPPSVFADLRVFARALAERYGPPESLADFVGKAQLAGYEAARAQFEAFTSRALEDEPATGVVYWMLNPPWPSLNWQLFDYDLDTPGAYWGAHKALERLHVSYAYDTKTVQVLNRTRARVGPSSVIVRHWAVEGDLLAEDRHELAAVDPGRPLEVAPVSVPAGVRGPWFLELELYEDAARRSRNVYWLSATEDVVDPGGLDWYTVGLSQYSDLRAVGLLGTREARRPRVLGTARATRSGADLLVEVDLAHVDGSAPPALHLHASLMRSGERVAPVLWDDNDITLFRGQTAVQKGRVATAGVEDRQGLAVVIEGFNLHRPLLCPLAVAC
ncbi:MAG: glycoside hydrolase family 2 [Actinomycetota bacterium]|nr:glycoside hydrolase family 2 [Actinomycetota bacterium]